MTAKKCALLGCYSASTGELLSTLRGNLSVPSSGFKDIKTGCSETSVRNYHYSFRNNPEERISLFLLAESKLLRIFGNFLRMRKTKFLNVLTF